MNKYIKEYFKETANRCIRCGGCGCKHKNLGYKEFTFGDLAEELLNEDSKGEIDKEIVRLVRSCDFCGACVKECPVNINAKTFMSNARAYLIEKDYSLRAKYCNVRIDKDNNIFSNLRKKMDIKYENEINYNTDYTELFFPSCHLVSKFPELTNKVYKYLRENGIADSISSECCGNTLYCAGLFDEFNDYAKKFTEVIHKNRVKSIITPCANCYDFFNRLKELNYLKKDISIKALPEVLVENNKIATRFNNKESITIHDSCPDRKYGVFSENVRKIFKDFTITEMKNIKKDTLCCGLGGLSGIYDSSICLKRKENKVKEIESTKAESVVTACFNCMESLYKSSDKYEVNHYLEYVFEECVDWEYYENAKKS